MMIKNTIIKIILYGISCYGCLFLGGYILFSQKEFSEISLIGIILVIIATFLYIKLYKLDRSLGANYFVGTKK